MHQSLTAAPPLLVAGGAARHAPACPEGRAAAAAVRLPTGLARHWRASKAGDGLSGAGDMGRVLGGSGGWAHVKSGLYFLYSTVVFWGTIGAPSPRYGRLLLGEHMGKDICRSLSELESLVGIQDQRLDERLGLLATCFPDGFEG